MLINEVEHIVGISKKSIRYYEENNLLRPKRNSRNDYRIYDEDDIERLKKVKFLRELGVPIRELKMICNDEMSLKDCLKDRIGKIETEIFKYNKVLSMCKEIVNIDEDFENFKTEKYLTIINTLGKEGFTMRNVKTSKTKKIIGATISSILFSLFFVFMFSMITYFQITEDDKLPWLIYIFIAGIFGIPILAMVYNLIARIKEILRGEEDEASKY